MVGEVGALAVVGAAVAARDEHGDAAPHRELERGLDRGTELGRELRSQMPQLNVAIPTRPSATTREKTSTSPIAVSGAS